jgi:hypothetical protein
MIFIFLSLVLFPVYGSNPGQTRAEFSSLEVAAFILCKRVAINQKGLT